MILLSQAAALQTIAFVKASNGNNNGGSGTLTVPYTVGTETFGFLVLCMFGDNISGGVDDITAVSWNSIPATLIRKGTSGAGSRFTYAYGIPLGTTAGAAGNIVITSTASHYLGVIASEYSGVAQTGYLDNSVVATGPSGIVSFSQSITSIADNCWHILASWSGDNVPGNISMSSGVPRAQDSFNLIHIFDSGAAVHPAGSNTIAATLAVATTTPEIYLDFTLAHG